MADAWTSREQFDAARERFAQQNPGSGVVGTYTLEPGDPIEPLGGYIVCYEGGGEVIVSSADLLRYAAAGGGERDEH